MSDMLMPSLLQVLHFFGLKRLHFPFPGKGHAKWTVVCDANGVRIVSDFYRIEANNDYYGAPQIFGNLHKLLNEEGRQIGSASGVVVVCIEDGMFKVLDRKSITEDYTVLGKLLGIHILQPDRVQEGVAFIFMGDIPDVVPTVDQFTYFKRDDAVEVFAVYKAAEWLRRQKP